jgi:hypothetical protein
MIILPPTITPRTRPELSSFVIDTIEAEGVSVPPSSRLSRMHDLYHSGFGMIDADHPDYEIAVEGEPDVLDGTKYAFAAKRLKGIRNLH